MPKATPVACTPDGCGDLFPICGKHSTYSNRKCRCDLCSAAASAYHRSRREADPEGDSRRSKQRRLDNPERVREEDRRRYARDREKRLAEMREHYARNSDRIKKRNLAYSAANPEVGRRALHKRRARARANGVFKVTNRDIQRLFQRHNHQCFYCGKSGDLTIDHVIPLVRGGRQSIGNLIPACTSCNCSKKSRTIVEWRQGRAAPRRAA